MSYPHPFLRLITIDNEASTGSPSTTRGPSFGATMRGRCSGYTLTSPFIRSPGALGSTLGRAPIPVARQAARRVTAPGLGPEHSSLAPISAAAFIRRLIFDTHELAHASASLRRPGQIRYRYLTLHVYPTLDLDFASPHSLFWAIPASRSALERMRLSAAHRTSSDICWAASCLSLGGTDDFSLIAYGPYDAERLPFDGIRHNLEGTEPRLKHLLPLISNSLRRQPVIKCEPLEDWVSHHGRLLLVGTAAHPIPVPRSIQENAMSVEDGTVLGRLFSHLRSRDQVNQFLWAFQDIRQPRCAAATESEMHNMHFQCMPNGADQETRDAGLRAKLAAGVQVLQAGGDQEETPEWREVKESFGYNAEDETDDWCSMVPALPSWLPPAMLHTSSYSLRGGPTWIATSALPISTISD
ncbi:hypothetical protein B0H14DRAFT_2595955 [Mycena olivaceomarginata]|nr:hypothetical protein B0H14DRAFT_2595955 [Mycena olivaceomarginata]